VGPTDKSGQSSGIPENTYVFRSPAADGADTSIDPLARGIVGIPRGTALLVVKRGPNAGVRFLIDKPVTSVGRHIGSEIVLDDISVSRRHAEFIRDDDSFGVVDVGSLNGTYVNRQPVASAQLANGDEIQIGKFRLIFLSPRLPRVQDN
jgi:pSer/pThr/pTyr-binding forkhead associated (FHA) protein